jgi:hypothetical protein
MSGIFLNNKINSLIESATESAVNLPKWITIVDEANNTELSSSYKNMKGGYSETSSVMNMNNNTLSATSYEQNSEFVPSGKANFSATSSVNMNVQRGGAYSVTSSEQDVNKLISMLTSESSTENFNAASETSTVSLENQLRDILKQEGGGKKKLHKQQGGSNLNAEEVKKFFMNLKSEGVNVDVKLNNKTMSDFFGMAEETSTDIGTAQQFSSTSEFGVNEMEMEGGAKKSKKKNSKKGKKEESEMEMEGGAKKKKASKKNSKKGKKEESEMEMEGGAKKKKASKKNSKKNSKKGKKEEEESEIEGGANAGFTAFLDLKKYIATKLGVSNGPKVGKVAGAVQRDMKEKFPSLSSVEISKKGMEHFDKNMDHYKQMLPK